MSEEKKEYYKPIEEAQTELFQDFEPWKQQWIGMPEFVQNTTEPYASVYVRFSCEEDMKDFSRLIGQEVTKGKEAKSIWHPKLVSGNVHIQSSKRYADADETMIGDEARYPPISDEQALEPIIDEDRDGNRFEVTPKDDEDDW